jgi:CBS domain containing-hemolysin-like protein
MDILALIIILAFIAFFSGIEIAFLSANKLRIELDKNKGTTSGKILSKFNENRHQFISTMLVGLNICVILFGNIMANLLIPANYSFLPKGNFVLLLSQTIITTLIVLFLGEFFPKALFRINPDKILSFFAIPLKVIEAILYPLTAILVGTSRFFMKTFLKSDITEHKEEFGAIDLEYLIKEVSNSADKKGEIEEVKEIDAHIFEKALYLKDVKVRECMVHRMKVEYVKSDASIEELRRKFIDTQHSRILICGESIDHIIGYIHHQELFKSPKEIQQIIRPILNITETMTARDLLYTFIRENKNIACVIDEYGGTAGIITLEDLMEEIFGEINDEHDDDDSTEKKLKDGSFILAGDLEIDLLNEKYDLGLPESEDYETLNGYIIHAHESIPDTNQEITIGNHIFKILNAEDNKINLVMLMPIKEDNS